MNIISPPDHLLTLDEFTALPEDKSRHYELQEGVLTGAPRPSGWHQRMALSMVVALDDALPPEWEAIFSTGVVVEERWPPTVRAPDVVIASVSAIDEGRPLLFPSDVVGVIEVSEPGSRMLDSVCKRDEYAVAGIPFYWIVDVGPPVTLVDHRLSGAEYREVWRGGGTYTSSELVAVRIGLDSLGSCARGAAT
ncbi:Uma2 family endonuclease [Saccharopolyspora sp. 5N102]|uniref:Uma2 family endonuclease n=1 Tax=Saccharopolyspora sp. 5N102 TaxID=3375155 RepID=UPI0037966F84